MTFYTLLQPFLLVFLEFILCYDHAEVHARSKEMSVRGWVNSVEGFAVRDVLKQETTEVAKILHVESGNNVDDTRRARKARRKRKRTVKKVVRRFQNSDGTPNEEIVEVKEQKKRTRKSKGQRKLVKNVSEKDMESILSESLERNQQRKPVDIIVHIKMND